MGVIEIVKEILLHFPLAIHEQDADSKNAWLLAVENRQPDIYNYLLMQYPYPNHNRIYQNVDKGGNSAIHLAATLGQNKPWPIPGAALQIQCELKCLIEIVHGKGLYAGDISSPISNQALRKIKGYKNSLNSQQAEQPDEPSSSSSSRILFIRTSTPPHFLTQRNNQGKTSTEVFDEAHRGMLKEGVKWLTSTSQSCSVVAALIATVAYASATTVPGGVEQTTGIPLLRDKPAFSIFTISSLVALCLSVTSLTMFLSILTSRNEISDFRHNLPMKLILGLSSLFISIAAMLVSFCAGHFFDLRNPLQHTALPIYAVTCLPVTIYAVTQFSLYIDLIKSIIMTVPKR
ncbi:ankyrin repeat-containing protein ITN1-like protein [Cinnamomum micranthum f. kanehirae]|uniref:Ankyrin repeat-containing protein ITN1-like protein n=1 Tax=Cinnamomum micranthum f. kanehirae TaxID=337451 RepID=A0A3S3MKZ4_9MAGN|nr:ankyrin repeat-containing protein ITN1-like protein [Cinnamomum micranthum f. kanehirae]